LLRDTKGNKILLLRKSYLHLRWNAKSHLVTFEDSEFTSKAAWTLKEAQELVEAEFEYVCDIEGAQFFRKHK